MGGAILATHEHLQKPAQEQRRKKAMCGSMVQLSASGTGDGDKRGVKIKVIVGSAK